MKRVVITGLGIKSSIGSSKADVITSLRESNTGIKHSDEYAELGFRSHVFGPIDLDLEELIDKLPVTDALKSALLEREGTLGEILNVVIAYEKASWDQVSHPQLTADDFRSCYLETLSWVKAICKSID